MRVLSLPVPPCVLTCAFGPCSAAEERQAAEKAARDRKFAAMLAQQERAQDTKVHAMHPVGVGARLSLC